MLFWPSSLWAGAELCLRAGAEAAARHGIPPQIMQALTLMETGRSADGRFAPWPWTINVEGHGAWFDSREEALRAARAAQAAGQDSFDLGCFQINHRWHGQAFRSFAHMVDPVANADYAARYLLSHYRGDWVEAAGRYHSRTPKFRDRYAARFERILANLPPVAPHSPAPAPAFRSAGAVTNGALFTVASPILSRGRGAIVEVAR
ncbi:hypothetical protein FHS89_001251 [Rubricella aquisinus]|uniref:Lytic transglycosylase domain-containing protein n=1 Tax=Rubricella aquisinus TaxID=2028108 RepID=A0A840WL43_9RHOB|nr:lytic transglycosylase domain-containing protein [Rubricella aquisinus]MBB5515241.1 hypothetical protein [Rubricella aquisinus]